MAELVDALDSKSNSSNTVRVRFSLCPPRIYEHTKYLKLKKQFNVNWKAVAVAHNRGIVDVDSDDKVSLNQLANRCERQIKIFYKK